MLSDAERRTLENWAKRRKTAQGLALRARIVLTCADGRSNVAVSARLGVSRNTVKKWRARFLARRLDGLGDEPRPGVPRTITDAQVEEVVVRTLEETPEGATHWSKRELARQVGISLTSVHRIWQAFGLQPWRTENFKISPDPLLIDKIRDVVGLYLVLAAVRGERCLGDRVVAGERVFRGGSGCGRVARDGTVGVSDKCRPSPVPFAEAPGRAVRCAEAPLLTVGNSAAVAEELLGNGLLGCPGCGGRLGGWGHAVRRRVFTAGRVPVAVRPRRARCVSCGVTHVLLPAWLLSRRCDGTSVIGDMLVRAAGGQGFRSIAAVSGVPAGTVRDRLRRFRSLAGGVREHFTRLAGVLSADPVPVDPAGSVLGDAVVAVAVAGAAAAGRWPALTVSPWELAAAVTMGTLLSPAVAFGRFGSGAVLSVLA